MLRKASEAVSEGNGPVHQEEEFGFGQPAPVDEFRDTKSLLKQQSKMLDELHDDLTDGMKRTFEQFSVRLEHFLEQYAGQRRYVMEVDETANTKTRERTEGAAITVQAMRGDSCTTEQKVQDGPNTSISFGMMAEPPDLPCSEDVLVEDGATVPETYLPSLEIRSSTAAGGLIPTGEASTASETTSNEPLLRFYATEETNPKEKKSWISTPYASYDSSVFHESNLFAAPYCRRVVETKSRQNRTYDPGGSQGHLRPCPFLGSWRALVCGEVIGARAAGDELQRFIGGDSLAL